MKIFNILIVIVLFLNIFCCFMLFFVKRNMSVILLTFVYTINISLIYYFIGFTNISIINLALNGLLISIFYMFFIKPARK